MGRSVRVAAIAAAMLFSLPAAAFAETGTPASAVRPVAPAVDCPAPDGSGPGGGSGTGEPPTGGDAGAGQEPGDSGNGSGDGSGDDSGDPASGDAGSGGTNSGAPGSGGTGSGEAPGDDGATGAGGDQPDGGDAGSGKAGDAPSGEDPPADTPPAATPVDDSPAGDTPSGGEPAGGDPAACDPAAPAQATAPASPGAPPAPGAAAYPGARTSAATQLNWGEPNKVDEFEGDLSGWNIYDGEGHAGNGRRSPDAASVKDGILTINGDAEGTTAGMAWTSGSQKYGRWEGRVRAPASDPSYNALLLLWPTAENFPVGGEVDFMEMTDHTRQTTELFLHYGEDNSQVQGEVKIDATQWHNWAVEWTPEGITAFVDGKEWWSTDDTSILPPGPMHLCVQLDWFPQGEGPVKPSKMEVDWIRQYSVPATEPGGGSGDPGSGGSGSGDTGSGGGNEEGLLDALVDTPRRITEGRPDPGSAVRGPSRP